MARYDEGAVAEDFGLVVGRHPGHQHLRFRQQQLLETVDLGLQRGAVVGRPGPIAVGGAAGADQHGGGEHGEAQQAGKEREGRNILPVKRGDGVADRIRFGASRRGESDELVVDMTAARNPPRLGRERSLSFAVRIVSGIQNGPKEYEAASATPFANHWTLLSRGLSPKESIW